MDGHDPAILITERDFDLGRMVCELTTPEMGAVVCFLGTVRDDGIVKMELEVFLEVAHNELAAICSEAMTNFGLMRVSVVHRYGTLEPGDNIVGICVGAGHRGEAFRGCGYIIDQLKQRVPIWKKEIRRDGSFWVEGEQRVEK
ncbi:MAG: molybdenum cofactor biosynthesis protein MoaE [Methanoregulaceae archaeon]|nr:molybdenum cofactor biosynthesis protein MoaE [Methanoregulaceae archaeon]